MAKCLVFIWLLLPALVFSQAKTEYHLLELADAIYEDTSNQLSSPAQLSPSIQVHEPLEGYRKKATAYWFHFTLPNATTKWVMEGYDFSTEEFTLFYKQNGEWKKQSIGWTKPYEKRYYDILNLAIDIPLDTPNSYYLKLYSVDGPSFKVYLKEQTSFTNYAVNENTSLGFFYGILLIIALYNLVLFVYLKERNHLLLALYIGSSILFSFRSDGFGFKFLWSNFPEINAWMDYLWSPILFTSCYCLYAIDFIKINKKYPLYFLGLITIGVLSIVLMSIEFFLPFEVPFLSDVYIIPFACVLAVAVHTYFKGNTYNRFFILGNSIVFVSIFISILMEHQFIEGTIFSVYSFDFAICLEIIILSLALADRIAFLKIENDAAREDLILQLEQNQQLQTKVNRELETKVNERTTQLQEKTIELVSKNEQLELLTEKLNGMNAQLDYDNWKLSKNIQHETLARLKGEKVSFEEFKRVFTDDLYCLRYLRDLKWTSSFSCVKCDHANYKETDSYYSRKCSKCSHIESVTSNTLLHRIRIPALKAFYISYVVYYNLPFTNEELGKLLDLTENTCWRFRKKISDMDKSTILSWEAFLMVGKE